MAIDRKSALCAQSRLTGIDFIQVVEPLVQDRLRLFFVVEPDTLDVPMVNPAAVPDPIAPNEAGAAVAAPFAVRMEALDSGPAVTVDNVFWRRIQSTAGLRLALEVVVAAPGDFGLYRLWLDDARIDPFFNGLEFSFKQGCPSPFDCRQPCEPTEELGTDVAVDYLARDFWSLRRALLDFAAARYPGWSEALEADQAVMLFEILAALGDEFAYLQDRLVREAALETATQRRSRSALARLVDYQPHPGQAAETQLALWVSAAALQPESARVWALPEGESPLPFSLVQALWTHPAWNALPLHQPDDDVECLPRGATQGFLLSAGPQAGQLPPGSPLSPTDFWRGRRAILRSRPSDPAQPVRAFAITLVEVEALVDELAPTPGVATPITRVRWGEPTPWPLPLAETELLLNIAQVRAGEYVVERFRVGSDAAVLARFPLLDEAGRRALLALPRAVEREGPYDPERGGRERVLRYGLRHSETLGLGWSGARHPLGLGSQSAEQPLMSLRQVLPAPYPPEPGAPAWTFFRDLLGADADSTAFTVEEGQWRELVTHQTPFEDVVLQDYANDRGWSLRFGVAGFGTAPAEGSLFEVRFATAPNRRANLPPDSLVHVAIEGSPAELLSTDRVSNPLPIDSGRDEEDADSIRIDAPEAFRAWPLRAVRLEDYSQIIERLSWVQRANASTRWTGSWATDFVAVDPAGGFELLPDQAAELQAVVDCIRQAGRDARVREPEYLDIDLQLAICVSRDAYPGEVLRRVRSALAPPGLFHPDNFSFGQALRRSQIEAAVQAVAGVKGVDSIRLRVRRQRDWREFSEAELPVEPWQIVRLQNDPRLPGRGTLQIHAHGGAT